MKLTSRQFFTASAAALAFGLAFVGVAQIITPEEAAARNTKLASNAKNLATGILIYAADYDQITISSSNWTKKIIPYIGKEEVMTNPWRPGVRHAFGLNKGYAGIHARSFDNVSRLVMVFSTSSASASSSGGAADLWKPTGYQKGAIGYADTHVMFYTKINEIKADWKPIFGPVKKKAAPAKKTAPPKKSKP